VIRENHYAASTVEVAEGQTVVSTGPYAIVRHPMYSGAILVFIGMPLALGSWWGHSPYPGRFLRARMRGMWRRAGS
jgi:protein-S-isoprenylcysteine O-methyltransferase Ste14